MSLHFLVLFYGPSLDEIYHESLFLVFFTTWYVTTLSENMVGFREKDFRDRRTTMTGVILKIYKMFHESILSIC